METDWNLVEHYTYLGQLINTDGSREQDIIRRIAKSAFNNMKQLLTSKKIATQQKMRFI